MHLKNILMYFYSLITVTQEVKKRGNGIYSLVLTALGKICSRTDVSRGWKRLLYKDQRMDIHT